MREAIRALDPDLPVYNVKTMQEHLQHGYVFSGLILGGALSGLFGIHRAPRDSDDAVQFVPAQEVLEYGVSETFSISREDHEPLHSDLRCSLRGRQRRADVPKRLGGL